MKKIDIHVHVRPENVHSNETWLTEKEQIEVHKKLNVEKGIILPFFKSPDEPCVLTVENARNIAAKYPDKFLWFTDVDLLAFDFENEDLYEFLKKEKELGAKGVGEITTHIDIDDEKVYKLFSCCERLSLPVLTHIAPRRNAGYGLIDSIGLPGLEKMLKAHPDMIYIGHSVPFWCEISKLATEEERLKYNNQKVVEGRLAYLMREYKNLYCDLSAASGATAMMRDKEYAVKFIMEFQDRIMYGCDITGMRSTIQYEFSDFLDSLVNEGKITADAYEKLCRKNAERLFDI
ncbi:MAG: amidohydrolase family protein [Clostridia bacterium]|nr:amidohydrolase family protein [Clostridia bacterium]